MHSQVIDGAKACQYKSWRLREVFCAAENHRNQETKDGACMGPFDFFCGPPKKILACLKKVGYYGVTRCGDIDALDDVLLCAREWWNW